MKLTFDHNQNSTMQAIQVNEEDFSYWLVTEHSDESERNHLMSCLEIFTSHFAAGNFEQLANELESTDFTFKTKVNMAWQMGMALRNNPEDYAKIAMQLQFTVMKFPKKSQWLEDLYKDVHNPVKTEEGKILLISLMHALIV